MRWSNILVGLALTGVGASLTPKQYIVEFAADTPDDLRRSGGAKHIKTYNSDLFIGAAIEVTHEDEAQLYASAPHVVNIWPNHALTLDSTSAPDQQSFEHDVAATSWNVHNATGVDQLHHAGILGQDVKVAIIDSGIWYRHDALGGCLGPKCKVAGGHDFSGNDGSGKHPDEDPDDIDGHGTHIAGIIAAVSVDFVGVAPNSTLYAYKVVGSGGGTDDATLIEALLRAYADDMDVVTVSISGSVGWAESAVAMVGSRLVRAGIIVTMSAGNAGAEGPFFGGSGGESPDVLTVASVQAAVTPAQAYNLTVVQDGYSRTVRSGYLPSDENFPASVSDWPVVPLSLDPNTAADACQPLPLGSPNLTHAVALVRRGGCTFVQKQQNLQALGAKFILVYNDDRALETPGDTLPDSLLASIAAEAGHAILAAIKAGAKVTADFSTAGLVGVKDPSSAGLPSTFTSWASTYDLQLKPDIAAPGGNIYSTWLNNTYQQLSGSSMATPYIAGIGALYISAFGGRKQHGSGFALEFARRVIASGSSLAWYDGTITSSEFKASPMQIGTGLVNAPRVLYANTSLDVVKFNLNDTTNFNPTHDLTITNNGAVAVSYKLRLEPAAGFEIQNLYVPAFSTWGVKQFKELVPISLVPDVQLPPSVELGPGESKKVT
jgi:subtilisin family serine protease